jgi:CO/xanthine dehydrogenase FAD-binding subunit
MTFWRTYLTPGSLADALGALREAPGPARVIAGGTDLLLDLQQGRHPPVDTLIDVSRIPELRQVREEGEDVFLGAAATHAELLGAHLVAANAACLRQACSLIGGPQVRNVGTLGGNVAHALPAADAAIALMALDARAELATPGGRREVPIETLFAGPGQVTFDRADTIVVGFRIRRRQVGEGSGFWRVMRPQGVAIAILNMAVWVRLEEDGLIAGARIAVGPSGPRPTRAKSGERALVGQRWAAIDQVPVVAALQAECQLRSSAHRATSEYRRHLLGVLLNRALPVAIDDARRAAEDGGNA